MSGKIRLKGASSGYVDITAPDSGANTTLNIGRLQETDSSGDISTGNITTTGYIRGPATFTIDPANHGDSTGTLRVLGNLTVDGTTTTINSTTVTTADKNIVIAQGAADSAATDGAGISVDVVDASLIFDQTRDEWNFNRRLEILTDTSVETNGPEAGGSYGLTVGDAATDSDSIISIKFNSRDAGDTPRHFASIAAQKTGQWADGGGNYPGALTFWTRPTSGNQAERMRIDKDGNVGINTNSPSNKLHVNGDLLVQDSATFDTMSLPSGFRIYQVSGSTHLTNLGGGSTNGTDYDGATAIYGGVTAGQGGGFVAFGQDHATNPGCFKIHTSSGLTIHGDSTGNVGIGTESPAGPLQVKVGTDQNVAINSNSGVARISAYDDAVSVSVPLHIQGQPITLRSGNSDTVTIDSSGNVGIGTTDPSSANLAISASSDTNIRMFNTAGTGSWGQLSVTGPNGQNLVLTADGDASGSGNMIFRIEGNTERMRIDASGNVFVGNDMSAKDLNNLSNILGVKNTVLDYYEFSDIKKTALYHNAYYTSGGLYRSPEIGGYGRLEIYSDSDTQKPQLFYRHGIATAADSNHATNNPEVVFGVDSVGTTFARRGMVLGTTADLSDQRTHQAAGLTLRGGTSDALLGVQDGNGRIQLKWNATSGTNETYLVSSEPAFMWDLNILSDPIWEMKYAPTGTADSAIPWQTVLSLQSTGALEAEDEVIGVVKRIHLKQTSNATSITEAGTGYFTWNTQTKIDSDTYTHSTSTGNPDTSDNITILKAGLYNIIGNFTFGNATASARNTVRVRVRVNGTAINSTMSYDYDRGSSYGEFSNNKLNTVLDLAVNDVVDVEWYGKNIDGTCTWHGDQSELIIMRIGKSS